MIDPADAPGRTDYRALALRMGRDVLEKRILKQAGLWAREVHQGKGFFRFERIIPMDDLILLVLQCTGLAGWGRRNFLDLRIVENEVSIPNLPSSFEGFRLMQLADLHCDLDPALMDVIAERLKNVSYDAVVLTGDYHNKISEDHGESLELMGRLIPQLHPPKLAILGNHDFIEKVAFLEDAGLTVLLNESVSFERGGARLWICGIDDPHYFQTDDLEKVRRDVPPGEVAILLSHGPEVYEKASRLGFSLMLCGHTHGGQICLPGGVMVVKNSQVPRRLLSGSWHEGSMPGYTSRGTGACGVPARFFCPPEITVHVLKGKRDG